MLVLIFLFSISTFCLVSADERGNVCEEKKLWSRPGCYADSAKEKDDVSVCDQSTHQGVRYQCYAMFAEHKLDIDICNMIPILDEEHQMLKDVCISDIAEIKKDGLICSEIATSTLRDGCYFQISQSTNDTSLCEEIQEESRKNWCYGEPTYIE